MKTIWMMLSVMILTSFSWPQGLEKKVTGTVFSLEDGTKLKEVLIQEEGKNNRVWTDRMGEFEILMPVLPAYLVVSLKGFVTQRILVESEDHINIGLSILSEPTLAEEERMEPVPDFSFKMAPAASGASSRSHHSDYGWDNHNTEEYDHISDNIFHSPLTDPLSTFSIDVDGASYSNLRRILNHGQLPPPDAIRIEELVNYFTYDYDQPSNGDPFSIVTDYSTAPWNADHKLLHIGLQGRNLDYENLNPANLVFLIDVSGSMAAPNKLPLLRSSLKLLLNELQPNDRIAVVAYAGAAGLVLPSCPASNKERILAALDDLEAGGSTAGGAGIELAYKVALQNLLPGGNNRVILATDGDFNVGVSSTSEMVRLIEEKRKEGIYLTITGFGMGNYKDGRMEQISNAGNGNYFYIDNIQEARKVFVKEMRANLFTIAKDVKIQIEFNPSVVQGYRLIGYENRLLQKEDFNNDARDSGELGAGHTVTALYEIIPIGVKTNLIGPVDQLKYQHLPPWTPSRKGELGTVKFRYKHPEQDQSQLIVREITNGLTPWDRTSSDFRFSAAVACYGMIMRNSEFAGGSSFQDVISWAWDARGEDVNGYRLEFINLVRSSEVLAKK